MEEYSTKSFCRFSWKSAVALAIFVVSTLTIFVVSLVIQGMDYRASGRAAFNDKWSRILTLIAAKTAAAVDDNLSIDNELASELYVLPSYMDQIDVILLVDRLNHPVFAAGENFEKDRRIIQSGVRALAGENFITYSHETGADYTILSSPVIRDGEIAAAIIMGIREPASASGDELIIISSLEKTSILIVLWVGLIILGVYHIRNRMENEENLRLTELKLASLGYLVKDSHKLAEEALNLIITAIKQVEGSIYIKDRKSGEVEKYGHFSTSNDSRQTENDVFEPGDPRLLAMKARKPELYSLSKSGHARLISMFDRTEKNRRLAIPLKSDEEIIGLLDIGINASFRISESFLNTCLRFSERVSESMNGLLDALEIEKQLSEIKHILASVEIIDSSPDLSEALTKITRKIIEIKGVRFSRIFTIDETGTKLILSAETWSGEGLGIGTKDIIYNMDDMPIHKIAILSGQSQIVKPEEIRTNIRTHNDIYSPKMERCVTLLVPLSADEYQLGCLSVGVYGLSEFPRNIQSRIENLCRYLSASLNKTQTCVRLKRSFHKLSESQDQVMQNERLSAISQLSGGVTIYLDHIFKSIRGIVEDFNSRNPSDEMIPIISRLENNLLSYLDVIERFKMFADMGKNGNLQHIELAQIVNEAAKQYSEDIQRIAPEGKEIMLALKVVGSGQIYGDREILKVMIREILFNSAESMPEGGMINIETRLEMNLAVLEITDQGTGIPDSVKNNVFQPFYSTRGGSGRGLGLSMVYGIVTMHDGTVDILSGTGEGSRVIVKIPLVDPEQTALYNVKKGTSKSIPLSSQ